MKIYNHISFGWRYNKKQEAAVTKKRSQVDFFISIVIAFLIIFIVAQVLAHLDSYIRSPFAGKDFSMLNPLQINVANAASEDAFKMIQSQREINIVKGTGFTFEVGFKNNTNYTWVQTGANSVDLKLAPPYSRDTQVRHAFWRDSETPAWLKDKQAKPGWLAYYKFALEAPKEAGVYTEKFVLVNYGSGKILSGSEFEITMNVWNSTSEFPKEGSKTTVAPKSQPSSVVVVSEPKPTTTPQEVVLTDKMLLGRKCLELDVKKFTIAAVSEDLIDDCKQIGIDLSDNIYNENGQPIVLNNTQGNTTNNTNNSSNTNISNNDSTTNNTSPNNSNNQTTIVNDPTPGIGANGPLVRVGLYYTEDQIVISANTSFIVKDGNGNVLANLSAKQKAKITFDFSTLTYKLVAQGNKTTSSYLRFEGSSSNTVFEIESLEQRPAWNPDLNDNLFLGALEIRYASSTGRLWVINELEMENYLKGLAESSNSSPLEYQKALITAARTYAMYHYNRGTKHADENFTVDAKYDQVYRGYGTQLRLPKVSQAVEETKGQIVTYNGELAITPYFSWSDGRTRDWQEVWGGSGKPWLVSVQEPQGYEKTTLYGHGVGLSAYGAMMLADNYNYTYDRILKYYYTGTGLKKIY